MSKKFLCQGTRPDASHHHRNSESGIQVTGVVEKRPRGELPRLEVAEGGDREANRFRVRLEVAGAILIWAAACTSTTTPEISEPWIQREWSIAQCNLTSMGIAGASHVYAEWFDFIPHAPERDIVVDGGTHEGLFQTNAGQWVWGYFDPNRREIHYSTSTQQVVRHEAGHAIMWALDHSWWRCYGHGDEPECPPQYSTWDPACQNP